MLLRRLILMMVVVQLGSAGLLLSQGIPMSSDSQFAAQMADRLPGFAAFLPSPPCSAIILSTDTSSSFKQRAERELLPLLESVVHRISGLCNGPASLSYRKVKYDAQDLNAWLRFSQLKLSVSDRYPARRINPAHNTLVIVLREADDSATARKLLMDGSVPSDAIEFELKQFQSTSTTYFEFQVDAPAVAEPSASAILSTEARKAGISGEVLVQFVVGPDGRPQPSTLKILRTNDDRLSGFVRRSLEILKYEPAKKGGEPVSQLVQQKFIFDLK